VTCERAVDGFGREIYRKAALKLVQDLGEDALPEPAPAAAADTDKSSSDAPAPQADSAVTTVEKVEPPKNEPAAPESATPKTDGESEVKVTTEERQPLQIPADVHVRITPENLKDYVGPPVYHKDRMYVKAPPPGVSTGLGYLGNGSGAVMPIEATVNTFYLAPCRRHDC
jgi:ATP-dependent Lon protease